MLKIGKRNGSRNKWTQSGTAGAERFEATAEVPGKGQYERQTEGQLSSGESRTKFTPGSAALS